MLWDAATGAPLATLEGHTDKVICCAFSPEGKLVATASYDETARLWDAATGALLTTFRGHTEPVIGCALSPDGARLVKASKDGTPPSEVVPAPRTRSRSV